MTAAPDPNRLDTVTLGPYLEAHVDGFRELQSIEKFKAGQSNPTYLVTACERPVRPQGEAPGQLLKSAHQVDGNSG